MSLASAADFAKEGVRWWSRIQVLADDAMEGRNAGSAGCNACRRPGAGSRPRTAGCRKSASAATGYAAGTHRLQQPERARPLRLRGHRA